MVIKKDQEYLSCLHKSGDAYAYRIRVIQSPVTTFGLYGYGKATVATVADDGRLLRQRRLLVNRLHDSRTTQDGQTRKTGYYLVKDVEATDGQ